MKKPERILWVLSALIVVLMVIALVKRFGPDPSSKPDLTPIAPVESNPYLSKYAGGYTVEVIGYTGTDIESFVLRKDGTATWMHIVPDAAKGARTDSKKYGTWKASEGKIVISIKGNTGTVTEEFNYRNEKFRSTISAGRYLKPTE